MLLFWRVIFQLSIFADVRRQSTIKFDTISVILNLQQYKKRAASKRNFEDRTRYCIELKAKNTSIRSCLVSFEDNTRLPKSKYQRSEYQKLLPDRSIKVTSLNYIIAKYNNTTSNLDYFSHCLRISKEQISIISMQQIYKLIRENGYLREELAIYKDTRTTFRELQKRFKKTYQILNNTLQDISRRLVRSERRLLDYWDVNIDNASKKAVIF